MTEERCYGFAFGCDCPKCKERDEREMTPAERDAWQEISQLLNEEEK